MSVVCNDPRCWCCGDPHYCDYPNEADLGTVVVCSFCGDSWTAVDPRPEIATRHPQVKVAWSLTGKGFRP